MPMILSLDNPEADHRVIYLAESLVVPRKLARVRKSLFIDYLQGFVQNGKEAFHALHPQYAQGDHFRNTIGQLVSYLSEFRKNMEWKEALDELEGTNAMPIMTIHKSKGLEYHTVVFVGFEDSAFWNFH